MKRLLIPLFVVVASSAAGEIYTWKDGKGTSHYANSTYDIPMKYRGKAKVLNLGPEPGQPAQPPATNQPAPQSSLIPPAPAVTIQPPSAAPRITPAPANQQREARPRRTHRARTLESEE